MSPPRAPKVPYPLNSTSELLENSLNIHDELDVFGDDWQIIENPDDITFGEFLSQMNSFHPLDSETFERIEAEGDEESINRDIGDRS